MAGPPCPIPCYPAYPGGGRRRRGGYGAGNGRWRRGDDLGTRRRQDSRAGSGCHQVHPGLARRTQCFRRNEWLCGQGPQSREGRNDGREQAPPSFPAPRASAGAAARPGRRGAGAAGRPAGLGARADGCSAAAAGQQCRPHRPGSRAGRRGAGDSGAGQPGGRTGDPRPGPQGGRAAAGRIRHRHRRGRERGHHRGGRDRRGSGQCRVGRQRRIGRHRGLSHDGRAPAARRAAHRPLPGSRRMWS